MSQDTTSSMFDKLPPEVQTMIFDEALVGTAPIIVWSMNFQSTLEDGRLRQEWVKDPRCTHRTLNGLTLGLLRVNRNIARATAAIFYSRNTFSFAGPHEWRRVVKWLREIGPSNQRYLSRLTLDVRNLSRAFQFADGSREAFPDEWIDKAFPRNPLLQCRGDVFPEGEVEDIDPQIEEIFSTLGGSGGTLPLTLVLRNRHGGFPGVYEDPENSSQMMEKVHFSMDLPNLVEFWRSKYGSGPDRRPIDVIWKNRGRRNTLTLLGDQFDQAGWDLLEQQDDSEPNEIASLLGRPSQVREYTEFTIRKRPLSLPLTASAPNPAGSRFPPSRDPFLLGASQVINV